MTRHDEYHNQHRSDDSPARGRDADYGYRNNTGYGYRNDRNDADRGYDAQGYNSQSGSSYPGQYQSTYSQDRGRQGGFVGRAGYRPSWDQDQHQNPPRSSSYDDNPASRGGYGGPSPSPYSDRNERNEPTRSPRFQPRPYDMDDDGGFVRSRTSDGSPSSYDEYRDARSRNQNRESEPSRDYTRESWEQDRAAREARGQAPFDGRGDPFRQEHQARGYPDSNQRSYQSPPFYNPSNSPYRERDGSAGFPGGRDGRNHDSAPSYNNSGGYRSDSRREGRSNAYWGDEESELNAYSDSPGSYNSREARERSLQRRARGGSYPQDNW